MNSLLQAKKKKKPAKNPKRNPAQLAKALPCSQAAAFSQSFTSSFTACAKHEINWRRSPMKSWGKQQGQCSISTARFSHRHTHTHTPPAMLGFLFWSVPECSTEHFVFPLVPEKHLLGLVCQVVIPYPCPWGLRMWGWRLLCATPLPLPSPFPGCHFITSFALATANLSLTLPIFLIISPNTDLFSFPQ